MQTNITNNSGLKQALQYSLSLFIYKKTWQYAYFSLFDFEVIIKRFHVPFSQLGPVYSGTHLQV